MEVGIRGVHVCGGGLLRCTIGGGGHQRCRWRWASEV